jgi:hypothetical protein
MRYRQRSVSWACQPATSRALRLGLRLYYWLVRIWLVPIGPESPHLLTRYLGGLWERAPK